jgi:hypothetical protein
VTRGVLLGTHTLQQAAAGYEAYAQAEMQTSAGYTNLVRATKIKAAGGTLGGSLLTAGAMMGPTPAGVATMVAGGAVSLGSTLWGGSEERTGQAKEWRDSQLRGVTGHQRMLEMAHLSGGRIPSGTDGVQALGALGAKYGMSREEAGSAIGQAASIGGYSGALSDFGGENKLLRLLTTGASTGAMMGYQSQMGPGAGGIGGNAEKALGLAMADGLRGAKLDQYLQAIASNTQQMASVGMQHNVGATETFLGQMRGTKGLKGLGERAPGVAGAMLGQLGSARQTLLSPFQGLAKAAVMRRALGKGGGMIGALKELDKMGQEGPGSVLGEVQGLGGSSEMTALALGSIAPSLRTGEMEAMAGGLSGPDMGGVTTRHVYESERIAARGANQEMDQAIKKFGSTLLEVMRQGNREMLEGINTRIRAL